MGGGLPYTVLYGEEPWGRGVILSLSRAVGNRSTQEQSVSKIHLESVSLSVQLVPSTTPELWGLYAVYNFHLAFKVLLTCYTISATKARPLSDPILTGNRNLGTISLSRPRERTYYGQQVMVASGRFHFSEVHSRCSKGSVPFT